MRRQIRVAIGMGVVFCISLAGFWLLDLSLLSPMEVLMLGFISAWCSEDAPLTNEGDTAQGGGK